MRRAIPIVLVLAVAVVAVVLLASRGGQDDTYRVRAIFMNAFSAIKGEDVKIAGVKVGKIEKIDVTPDHRAAVVLRIDRREFADFRRDAACTIRPQSLIGEKYVECTPTQPRADGRPAPPPLRRISRGDGKGQYLLPVTQTSQPVDIDLVNNIMRMPYRQRFAIIINELGTGLAGRGGDLRQAIRNADPALKATDQVVNILAAQNQTLRQLAVNGDRILAPLARERRHVAGFVVNAGKTAEATAERDRALEQSLALLPVFLRELKPTMQQLGALSDEMTPTLSDLNAVAPDLNRFILELGPFSRAGIPAVKSLGKATQVGRPALVSTEPILRELQAFAKPGRPLASNLRALTTSLQQTGGIERVMDYIFYQVAAINGYDSFSHYLRAGLILNPACTEYAVEQQAPCAANFSGPGSVADPAANGTKAGTASVKARHRTALEQLLAEYQKLQAQGKDPAQAARALAARQSAAAAKPAVRPGARSAPRALAMPSILPDADAPAKPKASSPAATPAASGAAAAPVGAPAPAQGQGGATPAQTSLLDYLLGGGS